MQIASIIPTRRDYHVTLERSSMLWKVQQEHRAFATKYTISKVEAVGYATELAREAGVSIVVHGMDGRIQYVRSYKGWSAPYDAVSGLGELA